jgi:hypothetical protein
MTDVTVPGGDGTTFTLTFGDPVYAGDDGSAANTAELDVFDLDYAAPQDVNTADISNGLAVTVAGAYNELTDNAAGTYTVPAGWSYLAADVVDPRDDPYDGFLATGDLTGSVADFSATGSTYTAGSGGQDIVAPDYMTIATSSNAGGFIAAQSLDTLQLDSGDWYVSLAGVGDNVALGAGDSTVDAVTGALIVEGAGTASVTLEQGNILVGGAGPSTVDMQGNANNVFAGTGPMTVTAAGAGDSVTGGSGRATVSMNGVSDAVFAGAGPTTVFAGGTSGMVAPGSGSLVVVDSGTGTSYFDSTGTYPGTASQGTATFFGDTAGAYLFTEDKQLYVVSGGGADTVAAQIGGDVVGLQAAPVIFGAAGCDITITDKTNGTFATAEGGNETINAGQSYDPDMAFFAGTGNDDLVGFTGGGNYFLASTGNATMSGGTGIYGSDLYEFANSHAGGTDVISTFGPGSALFLSGYGTAADSGIASETATSAGVQLDLTDGTKIIFSSLTSTSALDGSIFHI